MIKTIRLNNVIMFVLSFLASFVVVWLVLSHFRHAITSTLVGVDNSKVTFVDEPQAPTVQTQMQENSGCGCPSCCAISKVL